MVSTEERLLAASPDVLALFAGNPFPNAPPETGASGALAVLVHHDGREARDRHVVAARTYLGLYAPVLEIGPDGKVVAVEIPEPLPPHP